jgi:D-hydroxyproline dehydrogenase subunit gamma
MKATSSRITPAADPVGPGPGTPLTIVVDGEELTGLAGQTIGGILLAAGRTSWRTTARHARPRGVFCGIGVCYDCLVTVNDLPDVRACQRRATPGDVVSTDGELPGPGAVPAGDKLSGAAIEERAEGGR